MEEMNLFDYVSGIDCSTSEKKDIKESANPIIINAISKSAKVLFPCTKDELAGYHLAKSTDDALVIVSGRILEMLKSDNVISVTVKALKKGDESTTEINIESGTSMYEKAKTMQEGDKITALVNDKKFCKSLKYGPYFGNVSFKLFFKDNKKSVTEFRVNA